MDPLSDTEFRDLQSRFPRIRKQDLCKTSPADVRYNCVAHALKDFQRWWEPFGELYYWPTREGADDTVASLVRALISQGYLPSDDDAVEPGFEKVAIYAEGDEYLHVARQVGLGRWTSKLGDGMDLEHPLEQLEGSCYGKVVCFMKRPCTPRNLG
jgi:hypothetical protein